MTTTPEIQTSIVNLIRTTMDTKGLSFREATDHVYDLISAERPELLVKFIASFA